MPEPAPFAFDAVLFDIGGVLEVTGPMDFTDRWGRRLDLPQGTIMVDLAAQWLAGAIGEISDEELRHQISAVLRVPRDIVDQMLEDMWHQYLGEPVNDG